MAGRKFDKIAFGKRLKEKCKDQGYTQAKIADIFSNQYGMTSGCTEGTISNHWRGKAIPELGTVFAYCDLLDVTADWLLFGEGEENANRPNANETDAEIKENLKDRNAEFCLLSLFQFLLLSKVKINFRNSGVYIEGYIEETTERTTVIDRVRTIEQFKVSQSGGIYPTQNDITWSMVENEHISLSWYRYSYNYDFWKTMIEQFSGILALSATAFDNVQKYELAKTLIKDSLANYQKNLLSNGDLISISGNEYDDLPF